MDERVERYLRGGFRKAGRQLAEAERAYREGRSGGDSRSDGDGDDGGGAGDESPEIDLPRDEHGDARIVCRRYAERRAVAVDGEGRPACFDADHPDCRGCAEDVREGVVETW